MRNPEEIVRHRMAGRVRRCRLGSLRGWSLGVMATGWMIGSTLAASSKTGAGEVDFESLIASDILLTQTTAAYSGERAAWSWKGTLSGATLGIHYRPAEFEAELADELDRNETRFSAGAQFRCRLNQRLNWVGSAGAYSGFSSYREVWIAEYYHQNFQGLPGYSEPDPRGANASTGLRWEYLLSAGFVEIDGSFSGDVIAPSYDDVIDPEQGRIGAQAFRKNFNTLGGAVRFENVLGPRLRSQVELRFADRTLRNVRYGAVGWLNWAVAEGWVARGEVGYASEELQSDVVVNPEPDPALAEKVPDRRLEAWWTRATIERQVAAEWYVSVGGRFYHDTGEIDVSSPFASSAAPGLRSWQVGIGLRWVHEHHSARIFGGPYQTDYRPVTFTTQAFENLYRDRTFGFLQAAYSYEF
ncbi:MAG: hypothetical protein EXS36_12385 [Pedosphaera sp.]|nr:hypothetical protein [Pedosphaera sp.]